MTKKVTEILKKYVSKIPESKRPFVFLMVGILMLFFVFSTEFISKEETAKVSEEDKTTYVKEIEEKLEDIISAIHGAGKTIVMVTLDTSEENVYATDINNERCEYVVIKTSSEEGGLLLKITQPRIRGVAIVCEGGDSYKVKTDILNAVCSVLDISSSRVSISRMKNREGN